jgi:F5/8 type C domain
MNRPSQPKRSIFNPNYAKAKMKILSQIISTFSSTAASDWYAVDLGQQRTISQANLYLVADGTYFVPPDSFTIEYKSGGGRQNVNVTQQSSSTTIGNSVNKVTFNSVAATGIRITFKHASKQVAVTEIECY